MRKRLGVSKAEWDNAVVEDSAVEEARTLRSQLRTERELRSELANKVDTLEERLKESLAISTQVGGLEAERMEMLEALREVKANDRVEESSKSLVEDALLEMERKVDKANQEVAAAREENGQLRAAVKNEQKLSGQFRQLLTSLKQAFEEEKARRVAAEAGLPRPAPGSVLPPGTAPSAKAQAMKAAMKPKGENNRTAPPKAPMMREQQKLQTVLKENEHLHARLREVDCSLRDQMKARMKGYHIMPLDEFQEQLREEKKVRDEMRSTSEKIEADLRSELGQTDAQLKETLTEKESLVQNVKDLTEKLANIQNLLGH